MTRRPLFSIPSDWEAYLERLAWRRLRQAGERGPTPYDPEPITALEHLDAFCREQAARVVEALEVVDRKHRLGPELLPAEITDGQLDFVRKA